MDAVSEIKARLSIDQLVGQYVQLTKKGRNFVALCPFHQDSHPSFLVSPDKGICYCFPCQKGGDVFSFYQLIEGVDFKQALKDLADKAGVVLPDVPVDVVKKDEKERARECLAAAQLFFAKQLSQSEPTKQYLAKRGLSEEETSMFGLGFAPDSFNATYEYLLKTGYSRKEIMAAGLGVQKELSEEKIYDRFRNRLMFPIHDNQGRIIGFGGRTLGDDDAKYLNVSDGPLYRKSGVLFGFHLAQKAMRESKRAIIVEGYFDVLACHRVGVHEAVATCGTALTEDHVKLLKRHVEKVTLCLDQDKAGRDAAERAFILCSKEGLQVEGVVLGQKDPADAAQQSPEMLKKMLTETQKPYLDIVFAEIRTSDLTSPSVRHAALERLMPLLQSLSTSTERTHAVRDGAAALGTTETALLDDLRRFEQHIPAVTKSAAVTLKNTASMYSSVELSLGLFLLYPRTIALLKELIAPEEGFSARLYQALAEMGDRTDYDIGTLPLSEEDRHTASILQLYCEENGFSQWADSIATREVRNNCRTANRDLLHKKQKDITRRLIEAKKNGNAAEEQDLTSQYKQLLELSKKSQ
jgi:DNA primase